MEKEDSFWQSLDNILQLASAKWTIPLLRELVRGPRRPSDLTRALSGINPKILTDRLRDLENGQLVYRKEYREIPLRVEYSLTARGCQLMGALTMLGNHWLGNDDRAEQADQYKKEGAQLLANAMTTHPLHGEECPEPLRKCVYFISVGPGARDLVTVRGACFLAQAQVILYSGSRSALSTLSYCASDAQLIDTDGLSLQEHTEQYVYAKEKNLTVARLIAGESTFLDVLDEQIQVLDNLGIDYEVVPGVPLFTAAAAVVGCSLTKLDVMPNVIFTRLPAKTSKESDYQRVEKLAAHQFTMCINLKGADHIAKVIATLCKEYPSGTPVAMVTFQPQERHHISTLEKIVGELRVEDWRSVNVLIVGEVLQTPKRPAQSTNDGRAKMSN